MAKLLSATLILLAATTAIEVRSAHAQSGVYTFRMVNNTSYIMYIKLFSKSRNWVWPAGDNVYVLADRNEYSMRISCRVGEKVCYGGFWLTGNEYWGVGRDGRQGCTGCCITCGTYSEDYWSGWELVD